MHLYFSVNVLFLLSILSGCASTTEFIHYSSFKCNFTVSFLSPTSKTFEHFTKSWSEKDFRELSILTQNQIDAIGRVCEVKF